MNILVIDIGTTSTKGIVYDETLAVLSQCRVNTRPDFSDGICVEQDAGHWDRALMEIFKDLEKKGVSYDAVALTAQRSSVIPLSPRGEALHPAVMWQDRRTAGECLKKKDQEDWVYERTGLTVKPIYGAPKMEWFRRHEPEIYQNTWKFMVISDYCIYRMTGEAVTDHTYGNRTLLMDLRACRWDGELMELFGVEEEKLCRLISPGSLCGLITKEFAAAGGAKQGVPVYSAGGDQQCAALGLGLLKKGDTEITHGTGSFLLSMRESPCLDGRRILSCSAAAVRGGYLLEASCLTTGAAFDWIRRQFYRKETGYGCVNKEIEGSGPGAGGVVMLPHFQGAGTPDWNPEAKGLFFNLSLKNDRGDLARAVLEGIGMELDRSLKYLQELSGETDEICVSGGLSQLKIFNQIQADIYGKRLRCCDDPQASSVGAWMSCMRELGAVADYRAAFEIVKKRNTWRLYEPRPGQTAFYEGLKDRYGYLYDVLKKNGVYTAFAGEKEEEPVRGEKDRGAR